MSVDISVISKGRLFLTAERPFLATPLWRLFLVESPGLGTMAVDKYWRLYYDPNLDWDAKQVAAVLYHEISHLLRDHAERGENKPNFKWNIAADAEINDDIVSEKIWKLPKGTVLPETLPGGPFPDSKFAEWYFGQMKDPEKCDGSCQSGKQKKGGNGQGQGQGSGSGGNGNQPGQNGSGNNPCDGSCGNNKPKPMAGDCGSAAGGSQREWEQGDGEGTSPKISQAEAQVIARKVAEDIREQRKSRGDVPGDWDRWAEEVLNPKVNWAAELRAKINNSIATVTGMVDFSYRRPSRRQGNTKDIIFPAMVRPTVRVSVVIDTSGSMSSDDLTRAVTEVKGILKAVGVSESVNVISCDAAVHTAQKVFNVSQVKLGGGGGTDMRVGIDAALKDKPRPHIVIVLTDGYTPWPAKAPIGVQTIVGIIGAYSDPSSVPSWAKKIVIDYSKD